MVSEIGLITSCVSAVITNSYYLCSSFFYIDCQHGDLRLVGGETEYEGRVEVCVYGLWGTVCSRLLRGHLAEVICGQLGIDYASEKISFSK